MRARPHTYEVTLSEEQRFLLQQLLVGGRAPVRQQAHARILLKIDRNAPGPRWTDEQVAEGIVNLQFLLDEFSPLNPHFRPFRGCFF